MVRYISILLLFLCTTTFGQVTMMVVQFPDTSSASAEWAEELEHWWSLDEASGTLADSHGSADLTNNGATYGATGKVGDALDFDDDDYTTFSGYSAGTGDVSVTFWIYAQSATTGSVFGTNGGSTGAFFVAINAGGGVSIGSYDVDESTATSSYTISTGSWYFVAACYDQTANEVTFYINADSEVESYSTTFSAATTQIGGRDGIYYSIDAIIDNVNLWSKELTSTEAAYLYNSGNGRAYNDPGP